MKVKPFINTLYSHVEPNSNIITFTFKTLLNNTIIGNIMRHPNNMEGITQNKTLALFIIDNYGLSYQVAISFLTLYF